MRRTGELVAWGRRTRCGPFGLVRRPGRAHGQARRRQRRVRAVVGASLERSALRADSPAVLGFVVPSQNSLRSLRSLRSDNRDESDDGLALRARPRSLRFSAPQRRAAARPDAPLRQPALTFAKGPWVIARPATGRVACGKPNGRSRQAVSGRGDFWGDEQRRAAGGARSALPRLTRRSCLSAVSAANAASSATRPRTEQRSAVGAQRRPPRHEPRPGSVCRDAQPLVQPRSDAQSLRQRQRQHHPKPHPQPQPQMQMQMPRRPQPRTS